MNIEKKLTELLSKSNTLPFLFVGSGVSRRYLKTENWEGLLKKFATKEINYYKSSSEGKYPLMGSKIAEDFFEKWWEGPEYEESRQYISQEGIELSGKVEPFKFEVAKHANISLDADSLNDEYQKEIEQFKQIKISGIITTNYDCLIEEIFENKFKKYIGQEEMLFNKSYEIGEIYKIHGCCSAFKSIVISQEDYDHFEETNLFLTSKLLSFFIDYPVIFMGYSFSDSNIQKILSNILKSVGEKNISVLKERIVFVEWIKEGPDSFSETIKSINDINLPITHIRTNSFLPIFKALSSLTEHLPIHIIRQLKNKLYDVVKTDQPTKQILVREGDLDDIENLEVVVGIGVIDEISKKGYSCLDSFDLFENLLADSPVKYSPEKIIKEVLPKKVLIRQAKFAPVFQYLSAKGINESNYQDASLGKKIIDIIDFDQDALSPQANLDFLAEHKQTVEQYLDAFKKNRFDEIDFDYFRKILKSHLDVLAADGSANPLQQTDFKKLCCLYDRLRYGWVGQSDQTEGEISE